MSEARRIFGPPLAKRNFVRNATPKLTVDYPDSERAELNAQGVAQVLKRVLRRRGKDSEIAELNAQRVAQVLKRVLRRRKHGKGE
jgi:hypothetical protein